MLYHQSSGIRLHYVGLKFKNGMQRRTKAINETGQRVTIFSRIYFLILADFIFSVFFLGVFERH